MASLDQLDELVRQLLVRNLFRKTREFMSGRGLPLGSGWKGIKDSILRQENSADFGDFVTALETFVRDAVLVSNKRVYILATPVADPAALVPPAPADIRRDYLAATAPQLSGTQVSLFLEQREFSGVTVYTYLTARLARKTEEVDPKSLNAEAYEQFGTAKIVARYEVEVRCYDHIVKLNDTMLLLIDAPEGVDSATLGKDEVNYATLIQEQRESPQSGPPFLDLFPAVEAFWRDESEGIVNWLEFVSNKRAQISGRFSPTSRENYREHEFQRAGEKAGAQVSPYKIAIKWLERAGQPVVVLPGRAEMVLAGTLATEGASRVRLHHMLIPGYTAWEDFAFVLGRVRAHLEPGAVV
jgi:hypothetical protein